MRSALSRIRLYTLTALSLALGLASVPAHAVPSYARQTGMPCQSCHTVYPELTSFGRNFKMNGYTMTNMKQVNVPGKLSINDTFPFSIMVQAGTTHLSKPLANKQNNSTEFPQELSLYFAGSITPHMGAFVQMTYSQPEEKFGFDMADFRYSNRTTLAGNDLIYGVSMDNMPGMEDVWNTTPTWRYPYAAPDTETGNIPGPGTDVLVNGLMGTGLGAYAMLNSHWYASVNFYRTSMAGMDVPNVTGSINGVAPYVRLAWENTFSNMGYLEIGTYALHAGFLGGQGGTGAADKLDKYTDVAVDASYQLPVNNGNLISAHAVYINEDQTLDSTFASGGSSNSSNTLKQTRIDANYEFGHSAQLSLGYFNTNGDTDALLYSGNRTYSPDTNGFIAEADYLPWENTKFSLQYTSYNKFDGASDNYDNSSRNASDNNTLYANAWVIW